MHAVSLGHLDLRPSWLGLEPGRKCPLPLGLLLWYPFFMGKSIKGTTKKRRGRPATTGKGTQIGMRWQSPELSAIDSWMEKNNVASRPEAIRRLVEIGLRTKK
jgi:hypothetical protein